MTAHVEQDLSGVSQDLGSSEVGRGNPDVWSGISPKARKILTRLFQISSVAIPLAFMVEGCTATPLAAVSAQEVGALVNNDHDAVTEIMPTAPTKTPLPTQIEVMPVPTLEKQVAQETNNQQLSVPKPTEVIETWNDTTRIRVYPVDARVPKDKAGTTSAQIMDGKRIWPQEESWPIRDEDMPHVDLTRSPEHLRQVIEWFNVADPRNARYKANVDDISSQTFCNIFVWDVTRALGVEIPRWLNGDKQSANNMAVWLRENGPAYGWNGIVSAKRAQEMANKGVPVVAVMENLGSTGHIAMIVPGEGETVEGVFYPSSAQAGAKNFEDKSVYEGFNRGFASGNVVKYYAHEGNSYELKLADLSEVAEHSVATGEVNPLLIDNSHVVTEDWIREKVRPSLRSISMTPLSEYMFGRDILVDDRIYPDLVKMFNAAKNDGLSVYLRSGFRSIEEQQIVWSNVQDKRAVQPPGATQHHSGLAIDVCTPENGHYIGPGFEKTATSKWLVAHAWEYGFVQPFTANHDGIQNEPWHYMYVGKDLAKSIKEAIDSGKAKDYFDFMNQWLHSSTLAAK